MGNWNTNQNSKHNDYHGGMQRKLLANPNPNHKNSKLKRSKSVKNQVTLSTKKKEEIDEMVNKANGATNSKRQRSKSKKKSWLFTKKPSEELSDPAKILFEECKKDAIKIGKCH